MGKGSYIGYIFELDTSCRWIHVRKEVTIVYKWIITDEAEKMSAITHSLCSTELCFKMAQLKVQCSQTDSFVWENTAH